MSTNPYAAVERLLDQALKTRDPVVVEDACNRARLELARIAAGPEFDARRHRAIAGALRDIGHGAGSVAVAPLLTRGAR